MPGPSPGKHLHVLPPHSIVILMPLSACPPLSVQPAQATSFPCAQYAISPRQPHSTSLLMDEAAFPSKVFPQLLASLHFGSMQSSLVPETAQGAPASLVSDGRNQKTLEGHTAGNLPSSPPSASQMQTFSWGGCHPWKGEYWNLSSNVPSSEPSG